MKTSNAQHIDKKARFSVMSDLYQKNLGVIHRRWPELANLIDIQEIEHLDACVVDGKHQTISVEGIQLSSRYDPIEEAFMYRKHTSGDEYHVMGCGMGDVPKILMHDKNAKKVFIHIINPDVFKLVLHFTDQPWLNDERFHCLHDTLMNTSVSEVVLKHPGAIILPQEIILAKRKTPNLYYHYESIIFYRYAIQQFNSDGSIEFDQLRIKENLPLLRKKKPVDELFKKHGKKHQSVILIGAGPTLEENIDKLKEVYKKPGRPYIVAASMAGKLLYKHEIYPDVIVNVDRGKGLEDNNQDLADFFPFELARHKTRFVCSTLTPHNILKDWRGKTYYANLLTEDYDKIQEILPSIRLYMYGSVIASALHIAFAIATQRVYFMGMDFSFPDNKFHAGMDNSTHEKTMKANTSVINGYGEEVETEISYRTFLTGVENFISMQKVNELEFINCSRRGAKIANTTYLDDQEII
ncbi:motility associated factor glycosyltransferase family protein [Photobacterium galatheae]|uniref:motility associated factor glycosyltransferase family protein n=1 Tax=Photobacterium galatheae TaxID=1654360 RepID=UPI0013769CBD|nr:6-hydroxymethylpterin diphosphokinase MptE-like protein [Photobacterium galatheae]MCM0149693.1 motility associated factor glycosyltransferase family protein [Photobacterium galatheae]